MSSPLNQIAVDSCTLIDAIQTTSSFHSDAGKIYDLAEDGNFAIVHSSLVYVEVLCTDPSNKGRDEEIDLVRRYLERSCFHQIDAGKDVCLLAQWIRMKHNIFTQDSIHLATAILSEVPIFITRDGHPKTGFATSKPSRAGLLPLSEVFDIGQKASAGKLKILHPSQFLQDFGGSAPEMFGLPSN